MLRYKNLINRLNKKAARKQFSMYINFRVNTPFKYKNNNSILYLSTESNYFLKNKVRGFFPDLNGST